MSHCYEFPTSGEHGTFEVTSLRALPSPSFRAVPLPFPPSLSPRDPPRAPRRGRRCQKRRPRGPRRSAPRRRRLRRCSLRRVPARRGGRVFSREGGRFEALPISTHIPTPLLLKKCRVKQSDALRMSQMSSLNFFAFRFQNVSNVFLPILASPAKTL